MSYPELFEEILEALGKRLRNSPQREACDVELKKCFTIQLVIDASYSGSAIQYADEKKENMASLNAKQNLMGKHIYFRIITSCDWNQRILDDKFSEHMYLENKVTYNAINVIDGKECPQNS